LDGGHEFGVEVSGPDSTGIDDELQELREHLVEPIGPAVSVDDGRGGNGSPRTINSCSKRHCSMAMLSWYWTGTPSSPR
jgi:hypothetical protein